MKRDRALLIARVSKHQYYYKPTGRKSGRKPSSSTSKYKGEIISNRDVVVQMEEIKKDPTTDYGYTKMTYKLKTEGYIINKKKTYRLMKEHNMLKTKPSKSERVFVKYRKVLPNGPLEVLEMDIKFVWVEEFQRHAYVLTVIDTFTRVALYHTVQYSITQRTVKRTWEHIVIEHLQPNDSLNKNMRIEIRNDNDKRFSAKMVQDFFKENHLHQVFTHPYTPQENGHIESFHSILSRHLKPYSFWSLRELEQNLILFYESYNNKRIHASIAYTSPNDFRQLWEMGLIEMTVIEKLRKIKFKLKIPYHQIKQLTGNNEPKGSSLLDFKPLNEADKSNEKQMIGAETSHNLRYKKSPSVVPCLAKVNANNYICNT